MGKRTGSGATAVRLWAIVLAVAVVIGGGVMTLVSIGSSDGDYGQLSLPGATVLHLPEGQVNLTFTEDLDNQTVDEPATLHVTVTPAGGGAALPVNLDPNGDSMGDNGVTHTYWGYFTVPQAGDYRVTVPDDISPSIPNPQLLFGPDYQPQYWILGSLPIALLLIIIAIVANGAVRRRRAAAPMIGVDGAVIDEAPDTVRALLYVTGVNGAPPVSAGLGPVRVSGEIRGVPAGGGIPVVDHELTAPTADWPQVGRTLPILLSRGQDTSVEFVVLWEAAAGR